MTGPEQDPQPDPTLTPAQERAVRTLLAGARHDAPVPPDVVDRLDAALADLVAERGASGSAAPAAPPRPSTPGPAPVVPLARRRRRIATASLVAAAAVVVGGVAIGQVVGRSGDAGEASLAEDSAGGQHAPVQELEERRSRRRLAPTQERSTADTVGPPALDSATLRRDVRALTPVSTAGPALSDDERAACRVEGAGRGDGVVVTYDGRDGLLVFRAPSGGEQRVDLYLCGSDDVVRSVTLRSR